ncbi:isoprenyl transferase [Sphingomonadaceae bacterium G21617-S1]|uniref:isoprenyl transferase n=1 Tax=Rhizorhabdus sp. TaxID=1968843 RepID=UPI0012277F15|nr:isoprenyl transferase [Rhizorhabdus sp.]MBD3762009.1 isoprenyl transferase [Rhizorhabdus sp.]MCZ4343257.1 isoprenyl transferase [Sphingomonadaceae bacterium G21617-S1]TAK13795.1 MAG: isoprenyl transferase [Rhizorhabdus sp.]
MSGLPASSVSSPDKAAGNVPRHVAIIMDGNGRWAKRRFLPRIAGHRAGAEAVRKVVRAARDMGVQALTLYAFSSENWRRSTEEVSDLMGLLKLYLRREIRELNAENVRLRTIGDLSGLGKDLVELAREGVEATKGNTGLNFVLALNYGSQDEMVRAVRGIADDVQAGTLSPADIDAASIEARLDTSDLPPLDLLIRTSGERRLSNFLLWQAAYAELLFVDTLWPDFDRKALADAISDFGNRERRFGGR